MKTTSFLQRNHELRDAGNARRYDLVHDFRRDVVFHQPGRLINWTLGGYFVYRGEMSMGDFWRVHAYLGLLMAPCNGSRPSITGFARDGRAPNASLK
jgi:hypothetical protein